MIDGVSIATWAPRVLGWLKSGFGIFNVLRSKRKPYPGVSIVPHRHFCREATQPDGTVLTHLHVTATITNMRDVGLHIVKAECYVRWHGTVQTPYLSGQRATDAGLHGSDLHIPHHSRSRQAALV
jgi:hypothetical protein